MKISGIDANLLLALNALLKERNVTRAATSIGVGQPALSHSLARLREHFKDPLLIPKGRDFVLSEKASRLIAPVATAAAALADVFEERPKFDLARPRPFVIAGVDLFLLRFVPEIESMLRVNAPGIELEVRALAGRSTELILGDGVELAFGSFEDVPPAINQHHLFRDPYVCVVRADNPHVGTTMTLASYVKLSHLEVRPTARSRPGVRIDRMLAAKGKRRRVTLSVPYFLLAARILATSDHVLTMTKGFAEQLISGAPLRIVKCPLAIPFLSFSQIWPHRYDGDLTHRWLRESCARVCERSEGSSSNSPLTKREA